MSYPNLDDWRDILPPETRQATDAFSALLHGYLSQQHKDDGSHGAITADSVDIKNAGALTVHDETNPVTGADGTGSSVSRTQADGTVLTIEHRPTGDIPYLTLRATLNNALANILRLGVVGTGGYGHWAGLRFDPDAPGTTFTTTRPWDILSVLHNDGAAVSIADPLNNSVVVELFYDFVNSAYIFRPGTGIPVSLGSNAVGQRFIDAYVLHGYHEHGRAVALGEWASVAYNAGDYTANNGDTWTVDLADVFRFVYTLVGHTMTVAFTFSNTTVVTGAATQLSVTIPDGFTSASYATNACAYHDAGGDGTGVVTVSPIGTTLNFWKNLSQPAWSASTNTAFLWGQISFEVL